MSKEAYLKLHDICYGNSVSIIGPGPFDDRFCNIRMMLNDHHKKVPATIRLDNACGARIPDFNGDYFYARLFLLAYHGKFTRPGDMEANQLCFLSGPIPWEELAAEAPELWQDNAWHHSIDFSPLAGIVALEKIRHTGARRIYMLGQDLYKGDQEKAFAHDLKKNAAYLKQIVDTDKRVVLCEELKETMLELTL